MEQLYDRMPNRRKNTRSQGWMQDALGALLRKIQFQRRLRYHNLRMCKHIAKDEHTLMQES